MIVEDLLTLASPAHRAVDLEKIHDWNLGAVLVSSALSESKSVEFSQIKAGVNLASESVIHVDFKQLERHFKRHINVRSEYVCLFSQQSATPL